MYKLSLWEDNLDTSLEKMLTPLASSEVKAPTRAYNLILKHNINGQKTLTFEIFLKYFDINENRLIDNPLAAMVYNERRLKLFYDDDWYDFIIKSVQESSDKMTASITATDLFINELSRNGFEIELNQQLFNNQGTAPELGEKVLEGSDWSINLDECDELIQVSEEVCYECKTDSEIEVESMLGTKEVSSNVVFEQAKEVVMDYSNGTSRSFNQISFFDGQGYIKDTYLVKDIPSPISSKEFWNVEFDYILESSSVAQDGIWTRNIILYYKKDDGGYDYCDTGAVSLVVSNEKQHCLTRTRWKGDNSVTNISVGLYSVQARTKFKMTVSNLKITVNRTYSTKKVPLTYTTKKFYLPYSTYINREDPAQIIVIDDTLRYDSDDEVALYSTHNCFTTLDPNIDKINNIPFTKTISTAHRVEKILESPKVWYDERLGSIVNLYEGEFDSTGETKQLYCYEKKEVISPAINQNWIVNSKDFNSEWGWTGAKRNYNPSLNVSTLDDFKNNIKVIKSTLNLSTTPITTPQGLSCILNDGLSYYRDNIGELNKGDELICKVRTTEAASSNFKPFIAALNNKNSISSILVEGVKQDILSSTLEVIYKLIIPKNISFDDLRNKKYSFGIINPNAIPIEEVQLYRWNNESKILFNQESKIVGLSGGKNISLITGEERIVSNPATNLFPIHLNYPITNKETLYINFKLENSTTFQAGTIYFYMKDDANPTYLQKGRSLAYTSSSFNTQTKEYRIELPTNPDTLFTASEVDICLMLPSGATYNGTISNLQIEIDRTVPASLGDYFEPYVKTTYMFYDILASFTNKEDFPNIVKYTYIDNLPSSIKIYNNDYLKVKSITAAESNRLNILQSISEAFECWIDFQITRDSMGRVLKKQIAFKKYIERNNAAGIRYGLNLQSTTRTLDSNNLTTKMIVKDNSNNFAKNKFCSIARSKENPTRQKVLYDFDYYIKQQILDRNSLYTLFYETRGNGKKGFFEQWREYGELEQNLAEQYSNLALQYDKALAAVNLNETAIESAQKNFSDYNSDLRDYKGNDYNYYMAHLEEAYNLKDDSLFISYFTKTINAEKMMKDNEIQLISNKKIRDNIGAQLEEINAQLTSIRADKNQLDEEFYKKFARFLQEGTWISEDYLDDTEYYLNAANVLHTSAFPKITYTFSVIDVSGVEGYNFYEYKPGDKTWVQDTLFFGWTDPYKHNPVREEVIISEITSNLDDESKNTITVQNYKTQFEDLFKRIAAATQTIELNKGAYNRAAIASTSKLSGSSSDARTLTDYVSNLNGQEYKY